MPETGCGGQRKSASRSPAVSPAVWEGLADVSGTRGGASPDGTHPPFPFFFFSPPVFLGPHLQHMEVPRLGVESEL